MTNKEKFIEEFGYDGSIVAHVKPNDRHSGSCGYLYCVENCASRVYPRCPMWWEDEYNEDERMVEE